MKITANQVTLARIVLLPLPTAMLLFGSLQWHFIALVLFVIIGLGDLVDGILARKQGPTQFGAMLDPLADKMFIACIIVPFGVQGRAPLWLPAALLAREFLVTVLRSQMTLRQAAIKTSVLAKLKTSVQMGGFGLVFLNVSLSPEHGLWVFGALSIGAAIYALLQLIRGHLIRGHFTSPFVWIPVVLMWLTMGLYLSQPRDDVTVSLLYIILVVTWGSGIDYVLGSLKAIRASGLIAGDLSRLWWVLAMVAITSLTAVRPGFAFLVVLILTAEFAWGGLDNLRALANSMGSHQWLGLRATVYFVLAALTHVGVALAWPPFVNWGLILFIMVISVVTLIIDSMHIRPILAGQATHLAYSTDPPPRSASESD